MLPSWALEPAKRVAWLVSIGVAICAVVLELVNEFADLIPSSAQPTVRTVVGAVTVASVVLARAQALLTRAKVYSPATVEHVASRPLRAGPVPQTIDEASGLLEAPQKPIVPSPPDAPLGPPDAQRF